MAAHKFLSKLLPVREYFRMLCIHKKQDVYKQMEEKYRALITQLQSYGSVAVAFSGGVDSTFLLAAAKEALGGQVLAITACPCSFSKREKEDTERYCQKQQIRQVFCPVNELEIEGFAKNPPDRCYLCKKSLFRKMLEIARGHHISTLLDGSNMDDQSDYRPGARAIRELQIKSPLQDVGLYKAEIRLLSRKMGLPTWDKPSFACLASRFPYGEEITREKLQMVEQAEEYLRETGFSQFRVRMHGQMARIEVLPQEISCFLQENIRSCITDRFRQLGFVYVTLDLAGYRTGSMNEVL